MADEMRILIPFKLSVVPVFPLYKSIIPIEVKMIAVMTVLVIFSLKKIAIITATITGYMNKIVQAIPASM